MNSPTPQGSDYKTFWDAYSDRWDASVRKPGHEYLGDEWGSAQLTQMVIDQYVTPHLPKGAVALEIGCGSGKYSEKLTGLCKILICADVSGRMLERSRKRLAGARNVIFEKLNGIDLHQFDDDLVDYVFSFDCFVHIDMEDVYGYLREIRRVLKSGGTGLLHFANLNSAEGWLKFVADAQVCRGDQKAIDRFRFLTWETVEKFFDSLSLEIITSLREPWRDILVVFANRKDAPVAESRHQGHDIGRPGVA